MEILGIGSRIKHPSYGRGVVIRINKKNYDVCFIEGGIKQVAKDFEVEIIERTEPEYNVSFSEAEDALIKILLFAGHDGIYLQVADEGPGIAEKDKVRIFEKFYRAGNESTRTAQGTGLGLYLCKQIAADHKAQIAVTNNKPSGSVFTVRFIPYNV